MVAEGFPGTHGEEKNFKSGEDEDSQGLSRLQEFTSSL